jgi:hypothetical protein
MVSILPQETPWDLIGKSIGQNVSQHLPGAVQQGYNRGQLQNSLGAIKNLAGKPGTKPLDLILAAMQAGAGIPGSERYLGQLIPELSKFATAEASGNVPLPIESSATQREPLGPVPKGQVLPGFMGKQDQTNQFFPSNISGGMGPGNAPQPATKGQIVPLRTRDEKITDAKKLSKDSNDAGIPLTVAQALEQINADEEDKKLMNAEVEKERQQRTESQKTYGERGVEYLRKHFPKGEIPTAEQEAIFQKKAEDFSTENKSEAQINRHLVKEAQKFRNIIVNARKDLSRPGLFESIGRKLTGTYKNLEESGNDLRSTLKPLLDEGLYDTATNLMSEKGYGPEEIDSTLRPLGEQEKSIIKKTPSFKRGQIPVGELKGKIGPANFLPSEERQIDLQPLKTMITELKSANPNFSLVLGRKGAEDLNYNWRDYKNALNELEQEGFEFTDDQNNQKGYLNEPPLNYIQQVLHGLNLTGR